MLAFSPESASLWSLFIVGLMGGGHCIAMCGGLSSALMLQLPKTQRPWPFLLTLNIGRLVSYSAVGMIVGGLGEWGLAPLNSHIPKILYGLASTLLILLGLYLAGFSAAITHIEKIGRPLWAKLNPILRRHLPIKTLGGALSVGLLWGWLPCGLVYSASLSALASASSLQGGLLMLAFGLVTLSNLLAMGLFAERVATLIKHPTLRRVAGLSVCGIGLWQLWWVF